jgi:phage shock protein PspC (stress-responsive transcriptional regulator)
MYQGQKLAKDIKEASTARPSEYAEMLKLARQADLEQKRLEELNRTLATGIGAAQQAGGRAVVGALPAMVRAGDVGTQNILAQRQAAQLAALQMGAAGAEKEISREMAREQQQRMAAQAAVEGGLQNIAGALGGIGKAAVQISREMAREQQQRMAAQAAVEGGLQNIAGALGGIGKAAVFGAFDSEAKAKKAPFTGEAQLKEDIISSRAATARERRIGESAAAGMEDLMAERESLLGMGPEAGLTNDQYDALMRMKELGLVNFNAGGKVTKGAFNHKTNPIDIVQAGKKVGEMTGGEVILNPAQQKKLSQESAYFRSLLKKFNKKK